MILNLLNNILGLLAGIAGGVYYFLIKDVDSISDCFMGIGFALLVLLFTWLCLFLLIWLFFLVVALTINPKKEYTKVNNFYYFIFNSWYSYICSFFRIKIVASGTEKIPSGTRYLTVCNHRSNLDNMVQCAVLKKEKIAFISKIENFKIPFACQYMTRALYLPIHRGDTRKSLQTILKAISFIKNDVISIGVFPEGKRSKNGQLLAFKPGCLKIAEKTLCPVVVCTIDGTEKVVKNFPWKRTVVHFDIIKVYSKEEMETRKTVDLSDEIRNLMLEKLGN